MKHFLLLLGSVLIFYSGSAQEFSSSEGFYIGPVEVRPSLSLLAPELPESKFTLTEVNFNKEKKREVNLIAMMEKERYAKESSYIELESPMPNLSKGEKALIEVTNEFRMHDRGSNFDIYTGEKKIPAYQEMRVPLFSRPHYSRSGVRGYVSPYYYSPFLR